ncbi:MAG TPA: hypothetical protein VN667_20110 [Burkholderiales bacterium]|nr:hypothetical protein [Burkholderiales bacterium]
MTAAYLRELEHMGKLDREGMAELYRLRQGRGKVSVPFAMDRSFDNPRDDWEREMQALRDAWRADREREWQEELFKQSRHLADVERILASKPDQEA